MRRGPKYKINRTTALRMAKTYRNGATGTELGETYGISPQLVYGVLRRVNVHIRQSGRILGKPGKTWALKIPLEMRPKIVQWYKQKWSLRQIAERLGVSYQAIQLHLIKYGVKRRERGSLRHRNEKIRA